MLKNIKLWFLGRTISSSIKGFHKTVKVLEDTNKQYEDLQFKIETEMLALADKQLHISGKVKANADLLKNFKTLLNL